MNTTLSFNNIWKLCLVALVSAFLTIVSPAAAPEASTTNSTVSNILCNATNQLTGTIGRAISILIIISLAIALFLGKVSWGMAIAVAAGMGILFGARDVVGLLSGNTAC